MYIANKSNPSLGLVNKIDNVYRQNNNLNDRGGKTRGPKSDQNIQR